MTIKHSQVSQRPGSDIDLRQQRPSSPRLPQAKNSHQGISFFRVISLQDLASGINIVLSIKRSVIQVQTSRIEALYKRSASTSSFARGSMKRHMRILLVVRPLTTSPVQAFPDIKARSAYRDEQILWIRTNHCYPRLYKTHHILPRQASTATLRSGPRFFPMNGTTWTCQRSVPVYSYTQSRR